MSRVIYLQVKRDIKSTVKKAMRLAEWEKSIITDREIFLKVNYMSNQLVPGQCTSPHVLDAILKEITKKRNVIVGDADLSTASQLMGAAKKWGALDICKKYGVQFVNLSKEKTQRIKVKGEIIKELDIPTILLDKEIITAPIAKTHYLTGITCSLKNQWGLLPRFRHQWHPVVNKAIAEINQHFKPRFAIVDATITMEGNGPRTGIPKITNTIFAGSDLVSVDTAVSRFMGFKNIPEHIKNCGKKGIGSTNYTIVGDKLRIHKFKKAEWDKQPITLWENRVRRIPIIRELIFNTVLFKIPSFIATKYNTLWWYHLKGKKYTKKIMEQDELYKKEYEKLI